MKTRKCLQAQYDKDVELAKDRLIKRIAPKLHAFCDKWGLGFISGNGVYAFTCNLAQKSIKDSELFLSYLDPSLKEALNVDVGQCCIGCQMKNYEQTGEFNYKFLCVETNYFPLRVFLSGSPSVNSSVDSYGPISEALAFAIEAKYKKDNQLGLDLITNNLPYVAKKPVPAE
jgi:hypothetical protein